MRRSPRSVTATTALPSLAALLAGGLGLAGCGGEALTPGAVRAPVTHTAAPDAGPSRVTLYNFDDEELIGGALQSVTPDGVRTSVTLRPLYPVPVPDGGVVVRGVPLPREGDHR